MESWNAVPQELVVLAIVALIHPRAVLLKADNRVRLVEQQMKAVVDSLSEKPAVSVTCSPALTFEEIREHINAAAGSFLVLFRVNQLRRDVELKLGFELMKPDLSLRDVLKNCALIFTTTESVENMNPFLRRHILYKQDTGTIDVDSVLVEPPRNSELATHRGSTLNALNRALIDVEIMPELLRYMQDIIIFARTHRFAACGMRPQARADFELVVRTLCAIRGTPIATPITIKDAARLALPIHLRLVAPEDEPSLQYGGDPNLVKTWIKEWDPEVLIDFVLEQVPVPI